MRGRRQTVHVLLMRRGEGMVRGHPFPGFLVEFKHWKVGDPDGAEGFRAIHDGGVAFLCRYDLSGDGEGSVAVGVFFCELDAQVSGGGVDSDLALGEAAGCLCVGCADVGGGVSGDNDDEIVGFGTGQFADFSDGFGEGFFEALQIVDEFGALARVEERAVVVALLARELAYLGYTHGNDGKGGIDGERCEIFGCEGGLSVGKAGEAQVGLVDAVVAHGIVVGDLREGRGQVDADSFECGREKAFDDAEYGFLLREGHLQVNLGELGLAVGAQILVAEAARDLEVAVHAGDHEDLLKQLRRLRQGVEFAGMDAAGNEIIARAFGRGTRHEWRLDFKKSLAGEILASGEGDFVAHLEVVLHLGTAQVEIAILEADFFVGDCVVGWRERRNPGLIQDTQFVGDDFYFAGGHFGIDDVFAAEAHLADGGDDVLGAGLLGLRVCGGALVLVENDLREAVAVAEVEKDEVAVIASAVDPAEKHDGFTGVGCSQFSTGVGALQCA